MTRTTFYTDHWQHIEDERVTRYEQMFVWRDGHAVLLEPLDLRSGSHVLDFGCGPGFVSLGMANIVGTTGHVHGVDLNKQFVLVASERAAEIPQVSFHPIENGYVPLADNSVDRVLCKNVLEYVPSVTSTLTEFRRLLAPGGRVLVIDSDWQFVVVEPWGAERTSQFFDAASVAFKTPEIGRTLRSHLRNNGFEHVEVQIQAGVDTTGGSLSVLRNMASYATEFDSMDAREVDKLLTEAENAVETGEYLFSLPQFLVTGIISN
ncbi:MAG: methyltransferase domain-containing protein [Gammaproteobacteria bacterium]|nr:methyltransferase domain-containing protein [Gammaproteobacteria bacterium]